MVSFFYSGPKASGSMLTIPLADNAGPESSCMESMGTLNLPHIPNNLEHIKPLGLHEAEVPQACRETFSGL